MDLGQDNQHSFFSRIFIYQTLARCFLVASDKSGQYWRLLKFDKHATLGELDVTEDPIIYSKAECASLLKQINDGNLQHGGLQLVCRAYGIIGCFKFLEGYYLLLVTKKRFVGILQDQKVYGIDSTALVPLISSSVHKDFVRDKEAAAAEQRYRKLLAGVSLNTDFYFSYSLPLWSSVQRSSGEGGLQSAFASDRVWNEWLTRPLREALSHDRWVLPLMHGFWQQRRLALFGRTLTLTLIARRSRQFAGTRYLKRGVSDAGFVANDVEIEQVLDVGLDWRTGKPLVSSMVQVRGSIPLYWVQSVEGGVLKPDIVLQRFDPLYQATARHFEDLRCRYGSPVVVLNLVRQVERHPRETVLGREFANAVEYLNKQAPPSERVQYTAWDLSRHAKADSRHLLRNLQGVLAPLLRATGLFVSRSKGGGGGSHQRGVLRTNCIDCLDRTNVAQFAAGLLGLGRQLHALGISEGPALDPDSSIARQLMDSYESMGHCLSQQYGGSEAHTTFFQRQRGDWEPATQSRDMLTSLRRFYSNTYTDAEKQDSLNLFLGSFVPQSGAPHIWDLGSDQYLHTGRGVTGLAQRLLMGATSGAATRSRQSATTAAAAASGPPSRPPSREGSFDLSGSPAASLSTGLLAASGPSDGPSGTAMVSLSSSGSRQAQGSASAIPKAAAASPRSARGASRPLGSAADAAMEDRGAGPAGVAAASGGPEEGCAAGEPSTLPSEGLLGLAPSSSLRLTLSTDWVEVPTLTQLVEGASPSWHAATAAEASMEPLSLEGDDPAEDLEAGLGDPAPAAGGGHGSQSEATVVVVRGEDAEGRRQAEEAGQTGEGGVETAAALPRRSEQGQEGQLEPSAAPAPSPASARLAAQSPFDVPSEGGSPPAQPEDKAAAVSSPLPAARPALQQGAGTRKPPPSPRRHKLESFDKLIYKGPNAVRQVRLTATPATAPRQSPLTSWLPSPSRVKPKRPPARPGQPDSTQAGGSHSRGSQRPPLSPQKAPSQCPPPSPSPATSHPSLHTQPLAWPAPPTLWQQQPPFLGTLPLSPMGSPPPHRVVPVRLVRSSSDSTLLAASPAELAEWQAMCQAPLHTPAPPLGAARAATALPVSAPPAAGARRSLDGRFSEAGEAAPLRTVPGLLHSISASAVDLREYAAEAALFGGADGGGSSSAQGAGAWGLPAGQHPTPAKVPTGALVVMDAWAGTGGLALAAGAAPGSRPPQLLAVHVDGSWPEAASSLPPSPPVSRKSKFPSFSLQGLKRTLTPKRGSSALEISTPPPKPTETAATASASSSAQQLPSEVTPHPSADSGGGAWGGGELGVWGSPPADPLGLWSGMEGGTGVDPVAAMLAEEHRLREQYASHIKALSTPPTPDQSRALEQQLAALTRPSWVLSLGGGAGLGGAAVSGKSGDCLLGANPSDPAHPVYIAQQAQRILTV